MFRFCFLIVISFFLIVYYDLKAKYVIEHIDKYDNEYRYNLVRRVTTQVCFLKPISFEEYGDLSTRDISDLVKGRIEEQMAVLDENRIKNGYNRWKYK